MHFSIAFVGLVAPFLVSAAPFKRAAATDVLVLKFADVLEQLETNFYIQALQKFSASDFIAAGLLTPEIAIEEITVISIDEKTHHTTLSSAIQDNGGQPIIDCKFDFSSVLTDVSTMVATARVVENVGVGAYLGAAHLIADPGLLTSAASILTVEARHQTILNILNGKSSIPQSFDIGLTPSQVLAIAGGFISGCDLGIPANPSLTVTNTVVQAGTTLSMKSAAINGSVSQDTLFCQMLAGGLPFSIALPYNQCVVPQGINGPVALFVTSDSQPLAANVVQQATTQLIAGPAMLYVDSQPDLLSQMVRTGSGGSSASNSTSTSTVSSGAASSTTSSASAASTTATGSGSSASAGSTAASNAAASSASMGPPPNFSTGPSPDGHVVVNGWTNLPNSTTSP